MKDSDQEKIEQEMQTLKDTLEGERQAFDLYKGKAEQKFEEMGSEIRRQHEQYIEVLQSKDDQIILANERAKDLQV
jgi:uncharacterized protein YukE